MRFIKVLEVVKCLSLVDPAQRSVSATNIIVAGMNAIDFDALISGMADHTLAGGVCVCSYTRSLAKDSCAKPIANGSVCILLLKARVTRALDLMLDLLMHRVHQEC